MIEVVAGYIQMNNKILIAKRTYGDGPAVGKWEFPGGKINEGELDKESLIRELREELNILVNVKEYLTDTIVTYPSRTIHIKLYRCEYVSGNLRINDEHTEYELVDPEEIKNYDLVPADRELLMNISN